MMQSWWLLLLTLHIKVWMHHCGKGDRNNNSQSFKTLCVCLCVCVHDLFVEKTVTHLAKWRWLSVLQIYSRVSAKQRESPIAKCPVLTSSMRLKQPFLEISLWSTCYVYFISVKMETGNLLQTLELQIKIFKADYRVTLLDLSMKTISRVSAELLNRKD